MRREIVIFCIGAVIVTLGLAALLFPFAAVPARTLESSRTPQPMERIGNIDLGGAYGTVSVADLVGYYIEHPPAARVGPNANDAGAHHFRGC